MTWWRRLFSGDRDRTGRDDEGDTGLPSVTVPRAGGPSAPATPATPAAGPVPATHLLGVTPGGVEVRGFHAPADELVGWWLRLRAEHATTGLWPVLLGSELGDMCAALTPESRDGYDDAAELRRAEAMTPAELVALRAERMAGYGDGLDDEPPGVERPRTVHRNAPTFTVADDDGLLALVPAAHGWQVPVVLGWEGGVNVEMEPVDHAGVLRDWQQRFGAELVSLSGDQVLEVLVHRPPTDPAEALAVAAEQYAYCPDIVDQGSGSLKELAQDQVGSESWYFWWD